MNAFTESERTTYYFQVSTPAFNKSLHIFSRMFAEPLFDINYMNKEIDAVNSEAEKNLNSDAWRKRQVLKSISNPKHPYFKFSTGNNETLRGISPQMLNKKLKNLYEKYYRSANMKLAVLSNSTLDDLQKQITNIFSDIRTEDFKQNQLLPHNLTYSLRTQVKSLYGDLETTELPFYKNQHLGKIIYYKRISTGNILDIIFSLNSTKIFNDIKPLDYLDYMLKYSGSKSLINFLKKRNLANKMDSAIYESFKTFSLYTISVELTEEGLSEIDSVIKLIFNYVNKIKKTIPEEKIFNEIKKIYDTAYKFLEKSEDYSTYVSSLSTSMFDIEKKEDYKKILKWDFIHEIFDKLIVSQIMDNISIDNSIILIGSHTDINENIKNQFFKNCEIQKEKWYGTQFMINNLDGVYMNNLNQYPVSFQNKLEDSVIKIDPIKSFDLRKENLFITKLDSLVFPCSSTKNKCEKDEYIEEKNAFNPVPIYDDANLRIFYKIDKTFHVPKIYVYIHLISDLLKRSVLTYSNFNFFSEYLEYTLNTNLSEAIETGNNVSLEFDESGLTINISAYSDVIGKILEIIFNDIFKLQPNEYTFSEIYERALKNFEDNKIKKPVFKNKLFFDKLIKFNNTLYSDVLDFYYETNANYHAENNKTLEINKVLTYPSNNTLALKMENKTDIKDNNKKKILKVTKKQIFEDFKRFYEELKRNLDFSILFYGSVESAEELFKISKSLKDFINGYSETNSNISKKTFRKNDNNLKTNINLVPTSEKIKNPIRSASRKTSLSKKTSKFLTVQTETIKNLIHIHRKIDDQIIFEILNDADSEINHGISSYYQIGPRDIQRSLSFSIIDKCLGTIFYHNLRTIQQLGYIVHAGSQLIDSILYFRIIVQGTKKLPMEVDNSINEVILLAEDKLKKCEISGFEEAKKTIKENLLKKDDNLKERSLRLWKEIYFNTYEFDRYEKLLQNIESIKFAEVFNLFKNVFFENPNRLTIHQYSSNYNNTESLIKSYNNTIDYSINKNKKIKLVNDFYYYKNQPYIHSYKSNRLISQNTKNFEYLGSKKHEMKTRKKNLNKLNLDKKE